MQTVQNAREACAAFEVALRQMESSCTAAMDVVMTASQAMDSSSEVNVAEEQVSNVSVDSSEWCIDSGYVSLLCSKDHVSGNAPGAEKSCGNGGRKCHENDLGRHCTPALFS